MSSNYLKRENFLWAAFSSMVEGVLAVDKEGNVIEFNPAASNMLMLDMNADKGKKLEEVVKNSDLVDFIRRTMESGFPREEEIKAQGLRERYFQLHGTSLFGEENEPIGVLVVIDDVTKLKYLERQRSEFVANVSHELRTPLTSINGFVETLLDGAIDDAKERRVFLDIILRHSKRLNSIIDDLLTLSRIEREGKVDQTRDNIKPVLLSAIQNCEIRSKEKDIKVLLTCPEKLQALINAQLLEQAMVNLIDNAIKYSERGQNVKVFTKERITSVVICVSDEGVGIPEEHVIRVFERFYRIDKARSRKVGGTGLGLSIVKHIALAHGGSVWADSKLGVGSTFYIEVRK